jgi:hypothetical protein
MPVYAGAHRRNSRNFKFLAFGSAYLSNASFPLTPKFMISPPRLVKLAMDLPSPRRLPTAMSESRRWRQNNGMAICAVHAVAGAAARRLTVRWPSE